jgi:hypothetical protein
MSRIDPPPPLTSAYNILLTSSEKLESECDKEDGLIYASVTPKGAAVPYSAGPLGWPKA